MTPALEVIIGAKITDLVNGLKRAESALNEYADDADKKTKQVEKDFEDAGKSVKEFGNTSNEVFGGVAKGLAAWFSVDALIRFGGAVFDVTAEFQRYQAVLNNALGSQAIAELHMEQLREFATATPFGINELTESFVKLVNQGFTPTIKQIRQLGDLATSTGKSFDQLTEAILDAQVGEFGRLKELGIRAKDAGDQVIFTFKGVATEVEKTSSAIREYITGLGDAEGVTGSMVSISRTLEGQASSLSDSWDQMLLSIGQNTSGVFNSTIGLIDRLINKITELNRQSALSTKYDLQNTRADSWIEFFRPIQALFGADVGFTSKELALGAILNARDQTQEYVTSLIAGAKSANDFQKGVEELWSRIADARASGKAQKTINGMVDQINNGVKVLIDAQKQFEENASRPPDANFGTPRIGKSVANKAADEVIKNEQRVQIAIRSGRDKEIEEARIRYENLYRMAKDNSELTIQIAKQEVSELQSINQEWDEKELAAYKKKEADRIAELDRQNKAAQKARQKLYEEQQKAAAEAARKIYEIQYYYAQQMGDAIGNALEDALANGENIFEALGNEFNRMIIRMIADAAALKPANIFQGLISGKSGGGLGGFLGGLLGGAVKFLSGGLKLFGATGSGAGMQISSPVAMSSFAPGLDLSANNFSGNPSIGASSGIHVTVGGQFVQRGSDLVAVVNSSGINNKIFYGK